MRATLAGYVRAQAGDAGEGIRRHQFWGRQGLQLPAIHGDQSPLA